MKSFEYYGLFLTEESKTKLKEWLWLHKTGDTNAEDVLDNCLIELRRLKDNQSKAIVITYLLGTLPMDLQKFIAEQQQRIVVGIAAKNLAGECSEAMLGMVLMGAMLGNKDSDE